MKTPLRQEYCEARNVFDRTLRRTERAYRKGAAVDIEAMSTKNPSEFWQKIEKLGPRIGKTIPMEIVDDAEVIVRTENEVLEKWRRDFENLYNGGNSD